MIEYRTGNNLNLDAVIELYVESGLGARRPVGERDRMQQMIDHANLVITAWDGEKLIGIARSVTDFSYATYLSDLAVHRAYQRQGIGKELMRRTQQASLNASVILLAAPAAREYYGHVGFQSHPSAWILTPEDKIV
ncbi:GNAT family N-acetyltransferase [soil metagenome]